MTSPEADIDDNGIFRLFGVLWDDIPEEDQFYVRRPTLAHYTSLSALEKILGSDEVWFSNPLFMNDYEEVRFGIIHGARILKESDALSEALQTDARRVEFREAIDRSVAFYEKEHLLDTYVFCLTEHDPPDNTDGLLSMWRGYGGNGRGAAIVFDTSKLTEAESSPLILAMVHYGTPERRFKWMSELASRAALVIADASIPDDKLHIAAAAIFERLKLFALFTKHIGFSEEREWRAVYMSDRDHEGKLNAQLGYQNGPRGVEPKLRFKVAPVEGYTAPDLSLEKIVSAILLGPTSSSQLALRSVARMLEVIGKPALKDRLFASTIPFRTDE